MKYEVIIMFEFLKWLDIMTATESVLLGHS